jgi:hypothetical protein
MRSTALASMTSHAPSTQKELSLPRVVSAQEWQANLRELARQEKAASTARRALAAARRRMPMTLVGKDYRFLGPTGEMSLPDLFAGRRQLILYRFFYEPGVADWPTGACRGCSIFADSITHPSWAARPGRYVRDAKASFCTSRCQTSRPRLNDGSQILSLSKSRAIRMRRGHSVRPAVQ